MKEYRVFKTSWNSHLDDGHGGKYITYAVSGFHTKAVAETYAKFLRESMPDKLHNYPVTYEVRKG